MKKLLLTLMISAAFCGSIIAQHPDTHWPGFNYRDFQFNAALYASIMINGEPVDIEYENWDMLEVAAFVGDEMRMTAMWLDDQYVIEWGELFPTINADPIYYDEGGEVVTFKMYNHATGVLYEVCEPIIWDGDGEVVTILTGEDHWEGFDDPDHPLMLNFIGGSSEEVTFELEVAGYGEDNANTNKGYYLIASPVTEAITPSSENHFITDNYDLYYFDQELAKEWVNFKDTENGGWDVVNGKGYLYASRTTTVLTFTGTPNTNGEVTLVYNEEATDFPGLNLVGNPLAEEAYIGRGYYRMNTETRDGLIPAGADEAIDAMEGIFVIAETDGEPLTFSTNRNSVPTQLIINLKPTMTNAVVDRAIVNFEENQELPKIEILNSNTKIYFQKENRDFATINAGHVGEIPVSFEAEKNGSYTMNFTSKEVVFSYLHLIDNMTGIDVDLLQTPSYTFDATTSDYESRFRLVFATGSSVDGDSFSFINTSGNLCIFGIEGEATVQVIDILGHVLSSETFSGSYEKKINGAPGVYMVRLINGENVRVQKVVVR